MGNYNPKITISSAISIVDNLVVALAEATNPLVVVAYQVINPPHTTSVQLVFTGLNPVMHNVTIYETAGVLPAGTVRANFALDPRYPSIQLKLPVFAYAGTYPGFAVGGNSITDTTWIGWNAHLEIRGIGTMDPATEYNFFTAIGKIIEIQPGYAVGLNELWIITFDPIVVTVTPLSSANALFSSVMLISANVSLFATDVGKAFLIESVSITAPVITLPDLATMPENKPLFFVSQGGAHANAILQTFSGGQLIYYNGGKTKLYLGKSEGIWLFAYTNIISGKGWYVCNADTNVKSVGEIIYSYDNAETNTTFADGTTRVRNQLPRLWDKVQQLDSSMLISDATWLTGTFNVGRYSSGDGSTTFRVPKLFSTGFMRSVDGSGRKAGSFEEKMMIDHQHDSLIGEFPGDPNGNGPAKPSGLYNGTHTQKTDLSSHPTDGTGLVLTSILGTENRPANVGMYALIRT